jgi:hypothetical protein
MYLVQGSEFYILCYWLLVAGCWLLVAGCWLLVAGCWFKVQGSKFCQLLPLLLLFAVPGSAFVISCYWLPVTGYLLLVTDH